MFTRKIELIVLTTYQYGIFTIHVLVTNVWNNICNKSESQIWMLLATDILVCHLTCFYWVEWFACIFQRNENSLVVDVDVNIECVLQNVSN